MSGKGRDRQALDLGFLAAYRIDEEEFFSALEACTYARQNDTVLIAGSLVEGIGNRFSDIDVYVFTDRLRAASEIDLAKHHRVLDVERRCVRSPRHERPVYLIHTALAASAIKFDVEFRTYDELANLERRNERIFRYASDNLALLTVGLTPREQMLAHRLFTGIAFQGNVPVEGFNPLSPNYFSYNAYRWSGSDFSVFLDLLGAWERREMVRAYDLARENLFEQMLATINLSGFTCLTRKWIPTYVERAHTIDATLRDQFATLAATTGASGSSDVEGYVRACVECVDSLFRHCRALLRDRTDVPTGNRALNLLRRDCLGANALSQYAEMEFEYRAKVYVDDFRPTVDYFR